MRTRLLFVSLKSVAALAAVAGRTLRHALPRATHAATPQVAEQPVSAPALPATRRDGLAALMLLALTGLLAVWLAAGWSALARAQQDQLHDTPRLLSPGHGEVISSTLPVLHWRNPLGATQYELQITPGSRLGSGIHMYGFSITSYQPPAPPAWCCIEPGTLYFWRVRVSFAEAPVTPDDADAWGPWAEGWFFVARGGSDSDGERAGEIASP